MGRTHKLTLNILKENTDFRNMSPMRVYRMIKAFVTVGLVVFLLMPNRLYAQYEYIDINTPHLRKIPLAIPLFVSLEDAAADQEVLNKTGEIQRVDQGKEQRRHHCSRLEHRV